MEELAYKLDSEEMWKFLKPSSMQKLSKTGFFMPLMKKIVPLGFSKKFGIGWRYTWHKEELVSLSAAFYWRRKQR